MCGIAGYVSTSPARSPELILRKMTEAIAHRGPDGFGFYEDDWAHLGHRRLSIIDVAGGNQPMTSESRALWIVYNGEIFNHADLRPRLEAAGHCYQTRCDTETIVHAHEEYGLSAVSRFRGMFAYALWDSRARHLTCVRDRLGIKPFYYFWNGSIFAFASEIKALLEHPAISAELEPAVLPEYLSFGYVSEERTLFKGIRKLMPGCHLTLDLGAANPAPRIGQYWDVPEAAPQTKRSDREWIAETRQRLDETIRMRLMSDVPLGVFLSGGVDSSAIAAIAQRHTDGPLKSFSVGYAEKQYSELGYAAQVSQVLGTEHHTVSVGIEDFFQQLPRLVWHEDEPIAWPSSVSLYFVSKLAANQVKVVLTGEGSDELFGGYERYQWTLLNTRANGPYAMVPAPVRRLIRGRLQSTSLLNGNLRRKLGHTILGREGSLESLYLDNFLGAFSPDDQRRLLRGDPGAMHSNYRHYWDARKNSSALSRFLYADQKSYLLELLMKQDQMSMACSIESRVPLLDHTFVEFATSIPDRLKIHGLTRKYIFKKAVEDLLPRDIVHRPKKGFPTPIRRWLLDPRAEPIYAALQDSNGFLASVVDCGEVGALISRHLSRREDATDRLWRLLNLQVWGDLFLTGRRDRWWNGVLAPADPTVCLS